MAHLNKEQRIMKAAQKAMADVIDRAVEGSVAWDVLKAVDVSVNPDLDEAVMRAARDYD